MSHIIVYLAIPAKKMNAGFSEEKIISYTKSIMEQYVEETAAPQNNKIDHYVIGGRWSGALGALKGAKSALVSENGFFSYEQLEGYDAICNDGASGPYLAGEVEYKPVNGAFISELDLKAILKMQEYMLYCYACLVRDQDERIGGAIPDEFELIDGDLYINNDEHTLLLKKNETYDERCIRMNVRYGLSILLPDAYIDTDGNWHDENEKWDGLQSDGFRLMESAMRSGQDLTEVMQNQFFDAFEEFLDSLNDDDYLLILDGHQFP